MCVAPSHFSKILIILALAQQKASISTSSSPSTSSQVPLRVRFARAENDFQKRRREQSALYKQKQVEQDQWIPLRVEQAVCCSPFLEYIHFLQKITKLYKQEIGQVTAGERSDCTVSIPSRSLLLS